MGDLIFKDEEFSRLFFTITMFFPEKFFKRDLAEVMENSMWAIGGYYSEEEVKND